MGADVAFLLFLLLLLLLLLNSCLPSGNDDY